MVDLVAQAPRPGRPGRAEPGRHLGLPARLGHEARDDLRRAARAADHAELGLHRSLPDLPRRLALRRRRLPPHRAADRHPDPRPVVQHRHDRDRPPARSAAPLVLPPRPRLRPAERSRLAGRERGPRPEPERPEHLVRLLDGHRPDRHRRGGDAAADPGRLQRRRQRRRVRRAAPGARRRSAPMAPSTLLAAAESHAACCPRAPSASCCRCSSR